MLPVILFLLLLLLLLLWLLPLLLFLCRAEGAVKALGDEASSESPKMQLRQFPIVLGCTALCDELLLWTRLPTGAN